MKLTEELIQELHRLASFYDDPLLSDAAERLELCNKSNGAMLRQINRQNAELEVVKSERDRMLEDMRGSCPLCKYFNIGSVCEFATATESVCSSWEWRGCK